MDLQKDVEDMKNKIISQFTSQLSNQIHKFDLNSILGAVGLQVAKRSRSFTVPMLGAFAAGLAVGALFAPMSGHELRQGIGMRYAKLRAKSSHRLAEASAAANAATEDGAASPYDKAKHQRDGGPNGQKKGASSAENTTI